MPFPKWESRSVSVEEWWGRTFEGRGKHNLGSMPSSTLESIRKLSTEDLIQFISQNSETSTTRHLADHELRRRENWTGRFALAISILALVVSALR
jgi:hypothetical protein